MMLAGDAGPERVTTRRKAEVERSWVVVSLVIKEEQR